MNKINCIASIQLDNFVPITSILQQLTYNLRRPIKAAPTRRSPNNDELLIIVTAAFVPGDGDGEKRR